MTSEDLQDVLDRHRKGAGGGPCEPGCLCFVVEEYLRGLNLCPNFEELLYRTQEAERALVRRLCGPTMAEEHKEYPLKALESYMNALKKRIDELEAREIHLV